MTTNFELVFDKFIKKLKGDTQFFNYSGLTEDEINNIIQDHLLSLLDRAIDKLYEYGNPDINFYDKDNEKFNVSLVNQEISLLSDLMYFSYAEEDRNKLKVLGNRFRTSEVQIMFSPANDRNSYLSMIAELESKVVNAVSNYYSRDRKTWKIKSIYGGDFQ
ncbi:hypothetical protein AAHH67_15250 [Niallia circulans]